MAHYAELNENNEVIYVSFVDNEIITDENGNEIEELGIQHLHTHHGSHRRWVRTSYRGNFRGKYASLGDVYKEDIDMFISPAPYPSWILDNNTIQWNPPIPKPSDYPDYEWREDTLCWFSIRKYTYENYAQNYVFQDIQEVTERFNLTDNQLIPILSTEDYVVSFEKVHNFVIAHVTYEKWTKEISDKWKTDYIENVIKKANCDLYVLHKLYDISFKYTFISYMNQNTDFVFLEERNDWMIYKRDKFIYE